MVFVKLLDLVFQGLVGTEVFIYLDDIVFGALSAHYATFKNIAKRLQDANLTLNPQKCQFLQYEASFLGHIIGNGKICMCPQKIKVIKQYPVPNS